MKSYEEIRAARRLLVAEIVKGGLSDRQQVLLTGLSTALQWVCDEGGQTLEDLVNGRPLWRAPDRRAEGQ